MLEAIELRDELIAFFQPKLLAGKRVLVTAGPTFEPIDPVRGLTNRSSGKMGFAIARAAADAGAEVTLVAGPVGLETPRRVQAGRRHDARCRCTTRCLPRRRANDVFVATAAVADWRVAERRRGEDQEGRGQGGAELRAAREPGHPRRRGRACRSRRSASASPPRATTWSSMRARSWRRRRCR